MSTAKVNLVHETEAQRRHARVKLPAKLVVKNQDGAQLLLSVLDVSASGFSIEASSGQLATDRVYKGELLVKINSIELRLPLEFIVKYFNNESKKAGCEFSSLDQEKASLLRMLISKFLAGDLTTSADVLATLSRDNFVKERKQNGSGALSGLKKLKALVLTACVACIGLLAFSYVALNLYQHYFVVKSVSAMIDIDKEPVLSPTNGYYELLVDVAQPVERGIPLAVITSSVYEVMSTINKADFTSEQLKDILPPELNSLVKSPCNCRIVTSLKSDREFAKQGDLLFQVAALDAQPYVTAYFSFKDAEHITQNSIVHITIPGDKSRYTGLITNVVVSDNDKRPDSIIATIVPQQPLGIGSIARPVNVSIGEFFSYSDVDFSAIAKEFGTTIE
ncbi:PilZ domain-containing protein [Vibrio hepatarius]|uniref:PilZ domain-containing protein n=1 Tax=Vibrio hepatarius TaxID=171383 RepID=UPI00142D646A|nr:PilZ domain-containing protein [Vibrio hepatarius]NIY82048.1 PilZ domain-containing protein [Vibrio hepatarius]NVJ56224.1 PilZ domain-containing protein [Vibrionaceae bacterium]